METLKGAQSKFNRVVSEPLENEKRSLRVWEWVPWPILLAGLILAVLVLHPLAILIYSTLKTDAAETVITTENYRSMFLNPLTLELVWNSLAVAIGGSAIALLIGTMQAWLVSRSDVVGKKLIEICGILPMLIPPLAAAIAWSILFSPKAGIVNAWLAELSIPFNINIYSLLGMIFLSGIYYAPYVYMLVSSALFLIDPELEEASFIQGASKSQTVFKITLPLVTPAIFSAFLLTSMTILENFTIPAILGEPGGLSFITTHIFKLISYAPPQTRLAATFGVLLMAICSVFILLQRYIERRRKFVTVRGKGQRRQVVELGKWKWVCFGGALVYLFVAIILPILVLLLRSFRPFLGRLKLSDVFAIDQMTVQNFVDTFSYSPFRNALLNSLFLAVTTAVVGGFFYFFIAYITTRGRYPFRQLIQYVATIPLAVPGMVIGLAFLVAWVGVPWLYGTIWILALAFLARFLPQGVRTCSANLVQIHEELEEASKISGASSLTTSRKILLPLAKPAVVSAGIIVGLLTLREISASIFLYTSKTVVLSVAIFDMYEGGYIGMMTASCLVQVGILFIALIVATLMGVRTVRFKGSETTD